MPKATIDLRSRPPLQRMMRIHERLREGGFPNCSRLRAELELRCSKTVLRDITFMRDRLGLPIEYDAQRHGYYYREPVEHFPLVGVTESELFAILVAEKAVAQYRGTPFHGPLQSALQKLSGSLDEHSLLHLDRINEAMQIRLHGPEELEGETFRVAWDAVRLRRPLRFRYRKHARRTLETRVVDPYHLLCSNHRWYLLGWDRNRRAIRSFVISRIADPVMLGGTFTLQPGFSVEDHLKGAFSIFHGKDDFEVVVLLDAWGADLARGRRWHTSQEFRPLPDGGAQVTFRLSSLEEVESWVLSWGGHATVLRPRELVERVRRAADVIRSRYGRAARKNVPVLEDRLL